MHPQQSPPQSLDKGLSVSFNFVLQIEQVAFTELGSTGEFVIEHLYPLGSDFNLFGSIEVSPLG